MRIAHVMAGAAEGGAELFYERLCLASHAAGDDILPAMRRNSARAGLLRAAGMSPVELRFGNALDFATRRQLHQALRQFAPRAAVAWMSRANQHMPDGDWVRVGRLGGYYDLRYYRKCNHLVGNTQGIVDWLRREGWPADRTHYLPNFVRDFAAVPAIPREELGVPDGVKLLLGLGRLHTDKAFDTAIRALTLLPDAWLAIAGSGPERASLGRLAVSEGVAGRVVFLGWRTDPGALLRSCDVFVCSSRVEPLGNMLIEAWSAMTPVVAVAADGPRELVRADEDGMIVPHEDPAALAQAIRTLLGDRDLVATLAASGRRRFEDSFCEVNVLKRWRDFLATVSL